MTSWLAEVAVAHDHALLLGDDPDPFSPLSETPREEATVLSPHRLHQERSIVPVLVMTPQPPGVADDLRDAAQYQD